MATMREIDPVALQLQSQDFQLANAFYSDIDLAFQLQLKEVLASSMGVSVESLPFAVPHNAPYTSDEAAMVANADDFATALEIQAQELARAEQEAEDSEKAKQELRRLAQTLNQKTHDLQYAQNLVTMSDEEWEECGDTYEEPFVPKGDAFVALELCYKGISTSRLGFPDEKVVGIGVVLLDQKGDIVSEFRKRIDDSLPVLAAQYTALIEGLWMARSLGARCIRAFGDSKAVHRQIAGSWSKSRKISKLWEKAMVHISAFDSFKLGVAGKKRMELPTKLAQEAILLMSAKESAASGSVKDEQCPICLDDKDMTEMCTLKSCSHRFCRSCVARHAEIKISTGQVPVFCPESGCSTTVEVEELKPLLSTKTLDLLSKRLLEASIPEGDRIYCPFPNCSALMRKGTIEFSIAASSSSNIHSSTGPVECVTCKRLFCAECRVPWHRFKTCEDYQSLPLQLRDTEDAKLYELAKNNKWKRCKECRRMIELAEGCFHMTCRCGYEFCYVCGAPWKNKQATCKCELWDEQNLIHEPFSDSDSEDSDDYFDQFEDDYAEDDESFIHPPSVASSSSSRKSKLCRFFQRGCCRNGEFCTFAHGEDDLRKSKLCLYFQRGYCRNGDFCTFAHGEDDLRIR